MGVEVGGRWSRETSAPMLRARAAAAPAALQVTARGAWAQRWSGILSDAAQPAFATSLLELPLHGGCHGGGPEPELHEVLAELDCGPCHKPNGGARSVSSRMWLQGLHWDRGLGQPAEKGALQKKKVSRATYSTQASLASTCPWQTRRNEKPKNPLKLQQKHAKAPLISKNGIALAFMSRTRPCALLQVREVRGQLAERGCRSWPSRISAHARM